MIKILFVWYLLFATVVSFAQTKVWTGNGDGSSWGDALNWNSSAVPIGTDDVLLDNSVIAVSYTVNLPVGANSVSVNSLTITPSGSEKIILKLPLANTSSTGFVATGSGDAVVLNNGAVFINSSGATSAGTPVSVTGGNFFRINNGGRYIHSTPRGHTAFLVSRLSTVAGTEHGTFEFDVPDPSNFLSLPGRTFGNLVLSSIAYGRGVTYTSTGSSPLTINGDLEINSGVTLNIGSALDITVNGDVKQAVSSVWNLQSGSANNLIKLKGKVLIQGVVTETGAGFPIIELNGSSNQNVSVTGRITNDITLRMNNATGATLLSPLIIPYKVDLQNGKIKTDLVNILTLIDNTTVIGGSSASFVEGPMRKIGDDDIFSFPVGKGSIYAPVNFNAPGMSVTDIYEAEYFRANPQAVYGSYYEAPLIHHISFAEYWRLEKTSGSTTLPVKVELAITQFSFVKDINSLYVARFNPGDLQWKNSGAALRTGGIVTPPYITGSIISDAHNESGIFTLATNATDAVNPLPVNLVSFKVARINDVKVKITWELAADDYGNAEFEIERSVNGNAFTPFKKIKGNSIDRFYTAYDEQQNGGKILYRLKITKAGEREIYSNIASVSGELKGWDVKLFPNPVTDKSVINTYTSVPVVLYFIIYDAAGKEIKRWSNKLAAGDNHIPLQVASMKSGIYFLSVKDEKTKKVIPLLRM